MGSKLSVWLILLLFVLGTGVTVFCILNMRTMLLLSALLLFPAIFLVLLSVNLFIIHIRRRDSR